MRKMILAGIALMAFYTSTATAALPFLDAKVKTLVAFKDGTVFVLKEGKVTVGPDGKVMTSPISDAAFGTVGVNCLTEGVHVKMLTASAAPDSKVSTQTFADARSSAHGRPVTLRRRGSKLSLSGELLHLRNPAGLTEQLGMPAVTRNAEWILTLKQQDGVISLIPMSEIEELNFRDTESLDRDPTGTGQNLRITLEGAQEGQEVTISYYYLWKGVGWTPSYLLERGEDGKVRVELRGEISNQLLDLEDTELHLVVGVPNFMFMDKPSPLVAQKTLQQVTSALQGTPSFPNDFARNAQFTQLNAMNSFTGNSRPIETRQPEVAENGFAPPAQLPGAQSTDAGSLHLFKMEGVELAKGERAILRLATLNLTCRDLVTWDIADNRISRADHQITPQDRAANPLTHYWMLKAGDTPLTTGPALVMKGNIALSQDQIYYTPRHTEGRYQVGTAVGVSGSASETVLSREPGAKEVKDKQSSYQGKTFWLMREIRWIDETRELTVQLTNGHAFETDVHITRQFSGRPEENPEVSMQTLGGMDDSKDQLNRLNWKVSMKPGETKELKIRYLARVFAHP